jgi:hypothetical protein
LTEPLDSAFFEDCFDIDHHQLLESPTSSSSWPASLTASPCAPSAWEADGNDDVETFPAVRFVNVVAVYSCCAATLALLLSVVTPCSVAL